MHLTQLFHKFDFSNYQFRLINDKHFAVLLSITEIYTSTPTLTQQIRFIYF